MFVESKKRASAYDYLMEGLAESPNSSHIYEHRINWKVSVIINSELDSPMYTGIGTSEVLQNVMYPGAIYFY